MMKCHWTLVRLTGGLMLGGWMLSVTGCLSVEPKAEVPPIAATETEIDQHDAGMAEPVVVVGSETVVQGAESPEVVRKEVEMIPEVEPVVPGTPVTRHGDEIMVAGRYFRTGTPVVLWTDPGGYDGYRVERRFSQLDRAGWAETQEDGIGLDSPNRYGMRAAVLTPNERERVRGGSWDLATLQRVVDQFVLHYDASGTSAQCFKRLHDDRGLSIHFLLDVDGTLYQTLDLKERAWHATVVNSRSIGIEIANIGAYATADAAPLQEWYETDKDGVTRLTIPANARPESVRTPGFEGRPARPEVIAGEINGAELFQYDLTEAQYAALAKLTATLSAVFPNLPVDAPRNDDGTLRTTTLSAEELKTFKGVVGHYHIQTNKIDPGPALQWERILREAKALLNPEAPVLNVEAADAEALASELSSGAEREDVAPE
jgi:N-acetylmuramoyl-L-alanine amidase